MATPTYTKTGAKAASSATLDKAVFSVAPDNHELLKLAYVAYLANGRDNLARTKTRGEVSGGGRKPWKQKGTGRARFGSTRNPIWRTGGIVFGPTGDENYTKRMNVKAKRLAVRQALSLAAQEGKVSVIEALDLNDGKTKSAVSLLAKLEAGKSTLVVVADKVAEAERALRNVEGVKYIQARYANVYDILNADTLVITTDGLDAISAWLGDAKEAK